jgi:iron(III) transport system ATP-binding protein
MEKNMHKICNLTHRYGKDTIFSNLSMNIEQGECVAMLGQSGCGKTTLLRNIAGLETAHSGEIYVHDQLVFSSKKDLPPSQRNIGLVFQEYALFPTLTVVQNIAFGIPNESKQRIEYLLDIIGMKSFSERYPHQLSGGQQQRVALARALAPKPKLLLLDEPFANIDANRKIELGEELRRILCQENTSALIVTHDQLDALSLSDKVAVMGTKENQGYIAQFAKPEEVYKNPATVEVARLTGRCMILDGVASGVKADTTIGSIELHNEFQGKIKIVIRPESLQFKQGKGTSKIIFCACLGVHFQLTVLCNNQRFHLYSDHAVSIGSIGSLFCVKPCWAWAEGSIF